MRRITGKGHKQGEELEVETVQDGVKITIYTNNGKEMKLLFDEASIQKIIDEADINNDEGRGTQPGTYRTHKETDWCCNRKWQLLEFIRLHEPVTQKMMANDQGCRPKTFQKTLGNLRKEGYVDRRDNDGIIDSNARYVYYLDDAAYNLLDDHDCRGFLRETGNPYDPGPNNEYKDEVDKYKKENR